MNIVRKTIDDQLDEISLNPTHRVFIGFVVKAEIARQRRMIIIKTIVLTSLVIFLLSLVVEYIIANSY